MALAFSVIFIMFSIPSDEQLLVKKSATLLLKAPMLANDLATHALTSKGGFNDSLLKVKIHQQGKIKLTETHSKE